jgi:hypothetical protein
MMSMEHLWTVTAMGVTSDVLGDNGCPSQNTHMDYSRIEPMRRKLAKRVPKRGLRSSCPLPVTVPVGCYRTIFSP